MVIVLRVAGTALAALGLLGLFAGINAQLLSGVALIAAGIITLGVGELLKRKQ